MRNRKFSRIEAQTCKYSLYLRARQEAHRKKEAGGDLYMHVRADPAANRPEGVVGDRYLDLAASPERPQAVETVGNTYVHEGLEGIRTCTREPVPTPMGPRVPVGQQRGSRWGPILARGSWSVEHTPEGEGGDPYQHAGNQSGQPQARGGRWEHGHARGNQHGRAGPGVRRPEGAGGDVEEPVQTPTGRKES